MDEVTAEQPAATREEAVEILRIVKQKMEAADARHRAMRPPDERLGELRGPSQTRRTARRVRAGLYRPTWMTESAEELADAYDHAAAYLESYINTRRLAAAYRRMQEDIEDLFFDDVRDDFEDLKTRIRDFDSI